MSEPGIHLSHYNGPSKFKDLTVNANGTATAKINGRYFTFELKDDQGKRIEIKDQGNWDHIANLGLNIFEKRGIHASGDLDIDKAGISAGNRKITHKHGEKQERTGRLYKELDQFVRQCTSENSQSHGPDNTQAPKQNEPVQNEPENIRQRRDDFGGEEVERRIEQLTNLVHHQMETAERQAEIFNKHITQQAEHTENIIGESLKTIRELSKRNINPIGDDNDQQIDRIVKAIDEAFARVIPPPQRGNENIDRVLEHDRVLMQQLGELLARLAPKEGDPLAQQGVANVAYDEALRQLQSRVTELTAALEQRDENLETVNRLQQQVDTTIKEFGHDLRSQELENQLRQAKEHTTAADEKVLAAELRLQDFRTELEKRRADDSKVLTGQLETITRVNENLSHSLHLLERLINNRAVQGDPQESTRIQEQLENQINQQEASLQHTTSENNKLRQQIEELQHQLNVNRNTEDQLGRANETISNQNATLGQLRGNQENLNTQIANLTQTNEQLNEQLRTSQEEKGEIAKQVQELTTRLQQTLELQEQLNKAHTETREQLLSTQARLEKVDQQLRASQADKEQLAPQVQELTNQLQQTQELNGQLENTNTDMQEQLRSTQAQLDTLNQQLRTSQADKEQLAPQVQELTNQLQQTQELNGQLKNTNTDMQEQLRSTQTQLEKVNQQLRTSQADKEQLAPQVQELTNQLQQLNKTHAETQEQLRSTQAQLEKVNQQLRTSQADKEQLAPQVQELTNQLQQTQELNSQLKNTNTDMQEQLRSTQAQLEAVNHKLHTSQEKRHQLTPQVQQLTNELQQTRQMKEQLEKDNEELRRQTELLQTQLKQALQEQSNPPEDVPFLEGEVFNFENQQLKEENQNLQNRIAILESQLEENPAPAEVNALVQQVQILKNSQLQKEREHEIVIADLHQELEDKTRRLQARDTTRINENQGLRQEVQKLQEDIVHYKKQADQSIELDQKVKQLQNLVRQQKDQIASKSHQGPGTEETERIANLQTENTRLSNRTKQMRTTLASLEAEKQELSSAFQKEIEKVNNQNVELMRKLDSTKSALKNAESVSQSKANQQIEELNSTYFTWLTKAKETIEELEQKNADLLTQIQDAQAKQQNAELESQALTSQYTRDAATIEQMYRALEQKNEQLLDLLKQNNIEFTV